jgi:hypothetical protein
LRLLRCGVPFTERRFDRLEAGEDDIVPMNGRGCNGFYRTSKKKIEGHERGSRVASRLARVDSRQCKQFRRFSGATLSNCPIDITASRALTSINMAPPSQLAIATSSLQRLVKEEASYHKELEQQQASISKLESGGGDENAEYQLKQEVGEARICLLHRWYMPVALSFTCPSLPPPTTDE